MTIREFLLRHSSHVITEDQSSMTYRCDCGEHWTAYFIMTLPQSLWSYYSPFNDRKAWQRPDYVPEWAEPKP